MIPPTEIASGVRQLDHVTTTAVVIIVVIVTITIITVEVIARWLVWDVGVESLCLVVQGAFGIVTTVVKQIP